MWKWTVEFLNKFQGRGIKIAKVNSILVVKTSIFLITNRSLSDVIMSYRFFALSLHLLLLSQYTLGETP